jgi:hypothetical protein
MRALLPSLSFLIRKVGLDRVHTGCRPPVNLLIMLKQLTRATEVLGENWPHATFSTANPTWPGIEPRPLRWEASTNRLSYDMASCSLARPRCTSVCCRENASNCCDFFLSSKTLLYTFYYRSNYRCSAEPCMRTSDTLQHQNGSEMTCLLGPPYFLPYQ